MTIGIYSLYWEEQDLTYVGQSQNIEHRFKEHLSIMARSAHTNYKVQNAYNLYGKPVLIILEHCILENSNMLEILWTKELDSLHGDNGLNIIEAGRVGHGVHSNASKYTKLEILLSFRLLYSSKYTSVSFNKLSNLSNVGEHTIKDIFSGYTHLWLKDKYPNKYKTMVSNRSIRSGMLGTGAKARQYYINGKHPIVISPEGVEYDVKNICQFAREHKLDDANLGRLIRGIRSTHKGWTLKQ